VSRLPRTIGAITCPIWNGLLIRDAVEIMPYSDEWEIDIVTHLGSHNVGGAVVPHTTPRNLSIAMVPRTTLAMPSI
jgi:hypothetical protein